MTPGLASGAVAAAGLCGGDLAAVRRGVRSLSRVISGDRPPAAQGAPERFDLGLIQADVDPAGLAGRLEATGDKQFSLCLQGPPGTGKSAFVRYLAERLGLQVTQKRASDLMSMWVGATEQQIAAAFAEARAEESILVFDEADSLLADRRGAVRSWEVSQVNEMLTWMESHPLPFACTTNFGEHLDPATLRRLHLQGLPGLPHRRPVESGLPRLLRPGSSAGGRGPRQPDTGGLRGGAPQGGDPRPPARSPRDWQDCCAPSVRPSRDTAAPSDSDQ